MKVLTLEELRFEQTLSIVRIAPNNNTLELEYRNPEKMPTITVWVVAGDKTVIRQNYEVEETGSITIRELKNGIDYTVYLESNGKQSNRRLFRCGYIPGNVINYIHPEDYTYDISGRSPASPCLLRLEDGTLLASHDVYWGDGGQNLTLVFASQDNGETWHYRSYVFPCFWGKLFSKDNKLYIMGMSEEYGILQVFCSEDFGYTWSTPCEIMKAGDKTVGGPHKSAMPIVECAGRLWTAIDYGSWIAGGHASGAVSIAVDEDPMVSENWVVTEFLKYSEEWPGTVTGKSGGLLEGNMFVGKDGELYNILRYQTNGCIPNYGKAIILHYDKEKPSACPQFYKVIDFEGNLSKFTVQYDEGTKKYYSLVNRVISANLSQRNCLSLIASDNAEEWGIKREILNYQDNGWPEDYTKAAFQYVDFLFDKDDIIFASRTALNGAFSYHNANYITFHRIYEFAR